MMAEVKRLSPDLIVRWVMEAQPGATLCYASGWSLKQVGQPELTQWRYEETNGFVRFKQQRRGDGQGFLYLVERSSRPLVMAPGSGSGRRGVKA